jgi:TonB family protein
VIVYFKIHRNGSTSDISIRKSSENNEYDKYALDTISRAAPFPDLPEGYRDDVLGVYFEFKCNG